MTNSKRKILIFITGLMLAVYAMCMAMNATAVPVNAATSSWVPATGTLGGASTPNMGASGGMAHDTWEEKWKDRNTTSSGVEWIDRTIAILFAKPAFELHYYLQRWGLTIDSVILGRVKGGSVNYFSFELESGNPYGYTAAVGYAAIRGIVILFLGLSLMYELARQGVSTSAGVRSELKEHFYAFVISAGALYLMPNIVDVIIYTRDEVLIILCNKLTSEGAVDICDSYWNTYAQTPGIIYALLYLLAIIVGFYYMWMYISNAICCAALFAFFPVVVILGIREKGTILGWFKTMVGNILIPCIDMFLLFIPIYLNKSTPGVGGDDSDLTFLQVLLTLISVLLMIPMRGVIRGLMGLGNAGAGETLGMNAMAATMAFAGASARTAGSAGRAAAGIGGAIAEASDDVKQAKAERNSEIAKNNETASQALSQGAKPDSGKGSLRTDTDVDVGRSGGGQSGPARAESVQPSQGEMYSGEGLSGSYQETASGGGLDSRTSQPDTGERVEGSSTSSYASAAAAQRAAYDTQAMQQEASAGIDAERARNLENMEASRERVNEATLNLAQSEREAALYIPDTKANTEARNASLTAYAKANGMMNPDGSLKEGVTKHDVEQSYDRAGAVAAQQVADDKLELSQAKTELNRTIETEKAYAEMDKASGGSGQQYNTIQAFNSVQQTSAVNKAISDAYTNHLNYSKPERLNNLTAQQKYDYAMQNTAYQNQRYSSRRRAAVAKVATATVKGFEDVGRSMGEMHGAAAGALTGDIRMQRVMMDAGRSMAGEPLSVITKGTEEYQRHMDRASRTDADMGTGPEPASYRGFEEGFDYISSHTPNSGNNHGPNALPNSRSRNMLPDNKNEYQSQMESYDDFDDE